MTDDQIDALIAAIYTFKPGQKVRTYLGETLTVVEQIGCMVFVAERGGHYHPSKLFKVAQ